MLDALVRLADGVGALLLVLLVVLAIISANDTDSTEEHKGFSYAMAFAGALGSVALASLAIHGY